MELNGLRHGLAPPIDLEVRVTTPWGRGGRSLDFVLNSPSGAVDFHQELISGHPIHDPERFQQRLFQQLEDLHRGLDVDSEHILRQEVFQELTTIGHDLYQALFPRAMRNAYAAIRNRVETLLVTSDEPWIPWEILRPFDFDDDDFFCMRFRMSRWLTGETPLAAEKRIGHLLCLEAGELAGTGQELQLLKDLVKKTPGVDGLFQSHVQAQDLLKLLEEENFDLLHFTGHGEYDEGRPGEAKIKLDDRMLRARQLSPIAEKKLRNERPVVFFNSCQVGRLDRALTDLDGWAPRWVKRCGCSAFLAPFWSVNDGRALSFAQAFYGELREGRALGEAVLVARHKLRDEDPNETTWLAYSLYGHPGARILFGDHQPPAAAMVWVPSKAPPRLQALDPIKLIDRRAGHPARLSRRRLLGLAAAGALAILATLGLPLAQRWREPLEVVDTSIVPPGDGQPGTDTTRFGSLEPAREPLPLAPAVEPEPATPLLTVIPGKIGVVALDTKTRQPDADVAHAIATALARTGNASVVVKADVSYVERLMAEDFSSLPQDGRSPWGVEYLLVATVSRKELPQTNPVLESVALTMGTQLIAVGGRASTLRSDSTNTGIGSTSDAALVQAAERCLREIINHLNGSSSHEDSQ